MDKTVFLIGTLCVCVCVCVCVCELLSAHVLPAVM